MALISLTEYNITKNPATTYESTKDLNNSTKNKTVT